MVKAKIMQRKRLKIFVISLSKSSWGKKMCVPLLIKHMNAAHSTERSG